MKQYMVFYEDMDEPQIADEFTLETLIGRADYSFHTELDISTDETIKPLPGVQGKRF